MEVYEQFKQHLIDKSRQETAKAEEIRRNNNLRAENQKMLENLFQEIHPNEIERVTTTLSEKLELVLKLKYERDRKLLEVWGIAMQDSEVKNVPNVGCIDCFKPKNHNHEVQQGYRDAIRGCYVVREPNIVASDQIIDNFGVFTLEGSRLRVDEIPWFCISPFSESGLMFYDKERGNLSDVTFNRTNKGLKQEISKTILIKDTCDYHRDYNFKVNKEIFEKRKPKPLSVCLLPYIIDEYFDFNLYDSLREVRWKKKIVSKGEFILHIKESYDQRIDSSLYKCHSQSSGSLIYRAERGWETAIKKVKQNLEQARLKK